MSPLAEHSSNTPESYIIDIHPDQIKDDNTPSQQTDQPEPLDNMYNSYRQPAKKRKEK